MFANREDAARQLAQRLLKKYKNAPNTCVVGLARGGVIIASEVARLLGLPVDVVCPRKLSNPSQPEYALGAVAEHGKLICDGSLLKMLGLHTQDLEEIVFRERLESSRRVKLYRRQMKFKRQLEGKTVLVVDDGIATGSTMRAALSSLREEGASQLIIAVPVLPAQECEAMKQEADELYYVIAPSSFQAVGQFYREFPQVEDEEVVRALALK